ncbi:MAG: phosphoserine phosphatase SerB [Bacteriovoracaceae bacterium]|nr:phosphoserine phosphatase SerB [Bacteriovoracaceae bacterium]
MTDLEGKIILVTVSGPDYPGITTRLMRIIADFNVGIRDMGQAVTHGLLSLSFVLELNSGDQNNSSGAVLKDLLFEANKLGLSLSYKVVDSIIKNENLQDEKFVVTCVAPTLITSIFVADLAKILADHQINIERIDKVSPDEFSSLEIVTSIPVSLNWDKLKEELLKVSTLHKIDVAFLKDNVFRRNKRLIVFDMDSTLIQTEVIDELAELAGAGEEVKAVTHRAMNGEIDFDESLRLRVSKLKGLKQEKLQEVLERLPLTPGVEEFISTIKGLGYKVALISGGFTYFSDALKKRLSLDYSFANELEIINGELTGKVKGTIVNANQKAILVKLIAQQENISLEQVVAIGDGANDLPMLATAGLGIAFHAKDIVRRQAQNHMSHGPMTSILYFLGIPGPRN